MVLRFKSTFFRLVVNSVVFSFTVYPIQPVGIQVVSDECKVGGFHRELRFPLTNEADLQGILVTEILFNHP